MQGFVGREKELSVLFSFMGNPGVRGLAMYGIRQVGKSELLKHFAEGRRSVYIQLDRGSEEAIAESAVIQIRDVFPVEGDPRTIAGLLDVLGASAPSRRRWSSWTSTRTCPRPPSTRTP